MSSEKTGTSSSVSKQRRERSRKSNKLSGILLGLFVVASIGGAIWYWTQIFVPDRNARGYEQETNRISKELSSGVQQLTEWSTDEVLKRYSDDIRIMGNREGAQLSLVESLLEKLTH